jgi:hypothetical protein
MIKYDKYEWILVLKLDNKEYTYEDVSPFWFERFEFLRNKNFGRAMKLLKKFSYEVRKCVKV